MHAVAMQVLILTRSDDNESVELVARALKRGGHRAHRLDTDRYPQELGLSSELSATRTRRRLALGGAVVDLERVGAIWHRRFAAGVRLPAELGDTREACVGESRRTLYGTVAATRCFQLDPLRAVRRADHKELQLKVARDAGLDIPRTLFSNEPEAVRAFARRLKGPVITKMQHSFAIYRGGEETVVFTNQVKPEDLEALEGLAWSPMTFQEKLEKKLELRATVVGRRVFTAAVDSAAMQGAELDWRRQGVPLLEAWRPYQLPRAVERGLLKVTRFFELNYAAADFIVTPSGRHVFLEINAGGEFFWLQRTPGLPIAEALAECLTVPARRVGRGLA